MVYCLKAIVAFATASRRDAVATRLQTLIADRPRFGDTRITDATLFGTNSPAMSVTIRFSARADADDVWTKIMAFAEQRNPRPGSKMTLHTCTHDEDTNDCEVYSTREW